MSSPPGLSGNASLNGDQKTTPWLRRLVLICVTGLALGVIWASWERSIDHQWSAARSAAGAGRWKAARDHLDNYLYWHSDNPDAQLLKAEAEIMSEVLPPASAATRARFHLQQIPDSSDAAARARLQEARIALLLQMKPGEAQRLLHESLRLDDSSVEANILMWQLFDLTGRHVLSHPYFWRAYDLSPPAEHGRLLRDWFLSEFYPEDLHSTLFSQLGVSSVGGIPAAVNLLVRFRESEPEADFLHAALARYYLDLGNLKATTELLREVRDMSTAMNDSFFVSVLFGALIELGEFQKAEETFQAFPEPHDGYLYWRSASMYFDYVRDDTNAALHAFSKVDECPPAKFDWGLMNRHSVRLRKSGDATQADELRTKVDRLTQNVLTAENTSELRSLVRSPHDPRTAETLINFYREFQLDREVSAWEEYHRNLSRMSQRHRTP